MFQKMFKREKGKPREGITSYSSTASEVTCETQLTIKSGSSFSSPPMSPRMNSARNACYSPRNLKINFGGTANGGNRASSRRNSFAVSPQAGLPTRSLGGGGPIKRSRFSVENLVAFFNRTYSLADFEILATLGQGSFGTVYLARDLATNEPVAIKRLCKADVLRNEELAHLTWERRAMSTMTASASFLVDFKGSFQDAGHVYFVLEYCPGGEFFSLCVDTGRMDEGSARLYTAEVVLALEALHSHDFVFRDLKPENLLLAADGHLKLADFGFVRRCGEGDKAYTVCGTPEFAAPEMILSMGHGKEVDWWSLGCLLFEMCVGRSPFADLDQTCRSTLFQRIVKGQFTAPADLSPQCVDLISQLLRLDPTKRLGHNGADEIKAHPWFAGLDWAAVAAKANPAPYVPTLKDAFDTTLFHTLNLDENGNGNDRLGPLTDKEQLLFQGF